MQKKINFEVVIASVATLFLLLFANTSIARDLNEGLHRTVYESEALHSSPNFSKASHSRYYGKRNYGYKSKRNYYRGNRYYRGGNSHYRGHRYNNYSHRYYYPRNRYYGNRNHYRYRYGH